MTESLALRAYGRIVELSGPKEALSGALDRLPPAYEQVTSDPERRWVITEGSDGTWWRSVDGQEPRRAPSLEVTLEATLSDLELWVAEGARDLVFVHAGCVARGGRAIVLPGYSMSGKTTLTRALVDAGADYYSDEYAILDDFGGVRPYRRPLSVRAGGVGGRTERLSIAAPDGDSTAHVSLIAFLRYDPSSESLDVVPMTPSQTVLQILMNTVPAQTRPEEALIAASAAARDARGIRGTRGAARDAAALLLDLLEG